MARTIVRGTPYSSNRAGNEGVAPGMPKGMNGQTTPGQYRGTGMSTTQGPGTPYRSQAGNPADARRVVSADDYGKVITGPAGNMNDPASNGNGVLFDNTGVIDYAPPGLVPTLDSPVPGNAPQTMEGHSIVTRNAIALGKGAPAAGARDDILALNGVLSRGMIQKTSSSDRNIAQLTEDDDPSSLPPAGRG
jgi:hypothetical protein